MVHVLSRFKSSLIRPTVKIGTESRKIAKRQTNPRHTWSRCEAFIAVETAAAGQLLAIERNVIDQRT